MEVLRPLTYMHTLRLVLDVHMLVICQQLITLILVCAHADPALKECVVWGQIPGACDSSAIRILFTGKTMCFKCLSWNLRYSYGRKLLEPQFLGKGESR